MSELRARLILDAIDRMSGPMKRAATGFKGATREMVFAGKRASDSMKGMRDASKSMRDFGSSMSLRVTAPIVGFGVLSLRAAANFEQAMKRAGVRANATSEGFVRLEGLARQLGRTTQFSASQSATAMQALAQAGFKTDKIVAAMPGTLQLAAAANMDLGQAADTVTNIMSGYRFEAESLGRVNDVLVKAMNSANTDLSELGQAMKMAGPTAKGMGLEFEETAAILGIMGNNGLKGSLAGTALSASLIRLANPAKDAQKALAKLGINRDDIYESSGALKSMTGIIRVLNKAGAETPELIRIFGQEAGPKIATVVATGADALEALAGSLRDSAGEAARVAAVEMEGATGAARGFKSAFEGLQLAIADSGLLQWFTDATKGLTSWLSGMSASSKETLKWATIIAGIAAVIAPVIIAVGSLGYAINGLVIGTAVLKSLSLALLATPVGWFMAAVAAIAGAAYLIYDNWEPIAAFFDRLWGGIIGRFDGAVESIKNGLSSITSFMPESVMDYLGFGGQSGPQAGAVNQPLSATPLGQQQTQVGGELRIRIDGEGRPQVTELQSTNRNVPITVDTGLVMAGG